MKHWFNSCLLAVASLALLSGVPNTGESAASESRASARPGPVPFLEIYFKILEPSCAHSSCHDGNFEPNFTSPQAAYSTLVLHEVVKNNPAGSFQFRVLPYSPAKSLLIERITNCCMINESDRMPLLMPPISAGKVDSIRSWILNGAPDPYGQFPHKDLY